MNQDFFKLDQLTSDLEESAEKLNVILQDIQEEYFLVSDIIIRDYNFDRSSIKTDIALDYHSKLNRDIHTLTEVAYRIFEKAKEANRKAEQEAYQSGLTEHGELELW